MAKNHKEPATPPPMIGKIGPYTVFVTPPPVVTPEPQNESNPVQKPPVLPPPVQYEKSGSGFGSKAGFFWDAVAKVQNESDLLNILGGFPRSRLPPLEALCLLLLF
ncbi:hydroxyproline-rich glycoprotein family protein [Artemisia annua]|uniref:Hydroxyproline-rich glycoprotein family protein n=1 Tax=Artemisia annua TaxID=35608 RepID=A0A2U1LEU0_ARTAN|nr:hydroxyproline-rich glycoprotein family protein [Artemisia annua]